MTQEHPIIPIEAEEEEGFDLAATLETAKEYGREIKRNWKLVAIIAGALTVLLALNALFTKPIYTAALTFMVDEGSESGGGASGLLSVLGIGKSGDENLDKIVALSKSRQIVAQALFTKAKIKGQEDFFANHFIREYNFHDKWKKGNLKDFLFTSGDFAKFERRENSALIPVYKMLVGGEEPGLFTPGYTANSGILNLKLATTNEELSVFFLQVLFDKLSSYYILKNIEKEQLTYDLVKHETDSLKRVVRSKTYGSAKFLDESGAYLFNANKVEGLNLQQDGQIALEVYGKALANLELADFALKDNRPYIIPIDEPIFPVKPEAPSVFLMLVVGLIAGSVLGVLYVVGRKKFREFLAKALPAKTQD